MSNTIAGDVFEKVIQEVIAASQNDFEENGVQQQTLTELQQSWQHKLSQRSIAQMPWDPKPAPPPPPQSQQPTPTPVAPAPHNGVHLQHQAPNGQPVANGQPRIKPEPAQDPQQMQNYPAAQGYPQQMNAPMTAQQRAASLLHQRYGTEANASLNAMQQRGIALPGQAPNVQQQHIQQVQQQQVQQHQNQQNQQPRPQGLQLPGQPGGQPFQQQQHQHQQQQKMQQQYAQQMRNQTAYQHPQIKTEGNGQYTQAPPGQQNGVNYSQTDGADDAALDEWNRYMEQRRQLTDVQVSQKDGMMRAGIEALRRDLENGLMLPLDQQKPSKSRQRRAARPVGQKSTMTTSSLPAIPQLDGDAEEEDEDAINSDLDSSGDEAGKEDDEEEEMDSMLCTYDKVQRVKNKWKCTLKDGVLLANGKEYLFHKAQGEFEW